MTTTNATSKARLMMEHPAWKMLEEHYRKIRNVHLRSLFDDDPRHGERQVTEGGWFTVHTSVTEDIYKICAESFHGEDHLHRTLGEEQTLVNDALTAASLGSGLANREEKP